MFSVSGFIVHWFDSRRRRSNIYSIGFGLLFMNVKSLFSLTKSISLLTFCTCSCSAALQKDYISYFLFASSSVQVYRILWRPGLSVKSLKGIFVSTTLSKSHPYNASYMTNAFTEGILTICVHSSTIGISSQLLQLVAGLSLTEFYLLKTDPVFFVTAGVFAFDFFLSNSSASKFSGFFGLIQIAC